MAYKIGINGFGRIGRLVFRAINQHYGDKLEIAAINDLTDAKTNAHLLKYDSTYGIYPGKVEAAADSIIVDGEKTRVIAERDPAKIPWKDLGIDIVLESTGLFTDATKAAAHLQGGAKKVIISAPATNEDITIVLGVNEDKYDAKKHNIISNASCTTNCIAPVVKVLNDNFGIAKGLLDHHSRLYQRPEAAGYVSQGPAQGQVSRPECSPDHDWRRQGGCTGNTGDKRQAARHIAEGSGAHRIAVRLCMRPEQGCHGRADQQRLQRGRGRQAEGDPGILRGAPGEQDFKGNQNSSIFDSLQTLVIGGNMAKIIAWYDNEWGYSCRMADLALLLLNKGL